MRTRRTDLSDLDAPALAAHRDSLHGRPHGRSASPPPDLSRRHAFQCDIMSARTHEELEELERQRNEDAAREPIADTLEGANRVKVVVIKGGTLEIAKSEHAGCVDIVLDRDAIRARVVLDVDQACELIHELAIGVNEARRSS